MEIKKYKNWYGKLALFLLIFYHPFRANCQNGYEKIDTLISESENYLLFHCYDWSNKTFYERQQIKNNKRSIFEKSYSFSSLILTKKKTKDTAFSSSSPPFTFITITEDENYIIALSYIFTANPYQIVIYSISGKVIFKRILTDTEIQLDKKEFEFFKANYPNLYKELKELNQIYWFKGYWYLTLRGCNSDLSDSINSLGKMVSNHLVHAKISTKGVIEFYSLENPISKVKVRKGDLKWVEFNGKDGEKFKVYPDQ